MKTRAFLFLGIVLLLTGAAHKNSASPDEKAIRAMYDRYSAALVRKDLETMMSLYVPGEHLLAFDAFLPRQYVGAAAYRKAYENFFAAFPGPVSSDITDLNVTTAGTMAYARGVTRWVVTDKDGKKIEMVFRFTDVFRKINGKWLVVHEHLSFPADPATGAADLLSRP